MGEDYFDIGKEFFKYYSLDKEKEVRYALVWGSMSDTKLLIKCNISEGEEQKYFKKVLDGMVGKCIDWYVYEKPEGTPKDESIPFGKSKRIYHMVRPEFVKRYQLWCYERSIAKKISSK